MLELLGSIAILVFALVAFEMLAHIDYWGLGVKAFQWARVRFGRQIPVGSYRFEGEIGISFGRSDAILVLKLPVSEPGDARPTNYVGATDAATRFKVNRADATPDALLAAYDDSLGPLEIQVSEPGRITEIAIAAD